MNTWQWGACGLAALGLGVVAWLFLPVGDVHGHTKRLHEWWQWRHALRWERVRQEIAVIEASPEAGQVERLGRLFNRTAPHALEHGEVTRALIATGNHTVLPVVEEGIREEWPGVLNGIGKAVENRRADTEFRRGAFDALAIKLKDICDSDSHSRWSATNVASTLLLLSRERGAEQIRARLDPASRSFTELVEFSTRNGVLIPLASVRSWLHQAGEDRMDARIGKQVVALLAELGRTHPEEAIPELEKLMDSQPAAEEEAADALIMLLDLPHPLGSLIDLDYDQLGPEEQVASLVHHFGYYRSNLFAHALLEDNGHRLPQMEAALRKAGAVKSAEVVAKIRRELPTEGLPSDAKARYAAVHEGLRDLEAPAFRILEEADTAGENHFLLAMRYVLAHRDTILARRRSL